MSNNLPFPRGQTYWGGDSTRVTSTNLTGLIGRVFEVNDAAVGVNDTTRGHGTNLKVKLRVCKNSSGGNLTRARGCKFATIGGAFGGIVTGAVDTANIYGEPIDDYYGAAANIIDKDLFYTVCEGPVDVKQATHAATVTAVLVGEVMSWDNQGHLVNTGGAGSINICVAHENIAGTATGTFKRVYMGAQFSNRQ